MLMRMELALPRDARYVSLMRHVAECVLGGFEVPDEAIDDVKLAVTEACGNAVRHAHGVAEYSVRLGVGESEVEVEVIDSGPGFERPPLEAPKGAEWESGRGLFLMGALVDELHFTREDDSTCVRLVKRWEGLRYMGLAVRAEEPAAAET